MAEEAMPVGGIRRNAALAMGAELTTGVLTAVLVIFVARRLGPDGYGIFGLAMAIGALVILPADFGVSQSAARFLAERRGDRSRLAAMLSDALTVKYVASAFFSLLLFALASPIADAYSTSGLTWPLRAMAFAVFFQSIFMLLRSSFEGIGRLGADWQMVGGESVTEVAATIVIVALGGGAAGAVWGRAIGYAVGATFGIVLAVSMLGLRVVEVGSTSRDFVKRLMRYGFALMIIDAIYSAFAQIDVLLVGAIIGSTAAGIFAAPLRLTVFFSYPAAAMSAAISPRLARGEGGEPDVESLETGLRALMVVGALTLAPLIIWAKPIVLLLFGNGFGPSAGIMRALAPFIYLSGPTRLLTMSVNYLGEARRRIVWATAALVLNFVLDVILIHRIGVVGAAIGNDIAFGLYLVGHIYICRHLIRLPLLPLLGSFLRTMVAAGAMAGVLFAFGTDRVALGLLLLGALLGTLVFAAVLVILREPLVEELSGSLPAPVGRFLNRLPWIR